MREAARQGLRAARENLAPMLVLQAMMAVIVVIYYAWPAGALFLSRFARWQHAGGVLAAACATSIAGGVLSEISAVYFQDRGRWARRHFENAAFKMVLFFISGSVVYEFYRQQAVWFGNGPSWHILLPKILVDQFGYTVVFAVPYQATLTRWHLLGFSGARLWRELKDNFFTERLLPVLITNWMFWFPGVTLIYSMPQILQTPLFIFAMAIWGLLLPAVGRQGRDTGTMLDLVLEPGETVSQPVK